MLIAGDRLEVWGDPISHSRSPALHAAAYRVLGHEWSYGRRRVDAAGFAGELARLDPGFRGLSLTMPLKTPAHAAARTLDDRAIATGAVNTLLLGEGGPHGFNTDVGGLVRALGEAGVGRVDEARVVGAGATATSAVAALVELGAARIEVVARRPDAAAPLIALGTRRGADVRAVALSEAPATAMPLTLATLPGGVDLPGPVARSLARGGGVLYDVVYGHWPTALAEAWTAEGARAVSGEGMLLHQALLQVRIFASGDVGRALPDEDAVLAAMRTALADAVVADAVGD